MPRNSDPPEFLTRYLNDPRYRADVPAKRVPDRASYRWEMLGVIQIPVADIHEAFGRGCHCGKYGCDCPIRRGEHAAQQS